jgi:hypothetical protein
MICQELSGSNRKLWGKNKQTNKMNQFKNTKPKKKTKTKTKKPPKNLGLELALSLEAEGL